MGYNVKKDKEQINVSFPEIVFLCEQLLKL